jgi:heat-inducible transcriptional repressor
VTPGREVYTLIGDEIPVENLAKSTVIFTPYKVSEKGGFLAILGPSRLNYQKVIPIVKYTRKLLEELGGSW